MSEYSNRIYKGVIDHQKVGKVEVIKSLIPSGVASIIDIGCGNGLITNELSFSYDVLGVDINASKLEHVNTHKLLSPCDDIKKPDQSFDMVFSSELLEHLDNRLLKNTLSEFERLAKNYILITVPNNEQLSKLKIKCNSCGKIYHKNGHLHSFDYEFLSSLFSDFELVNHLAFGKKVRGYHPSLANLKHQTTPANTWIPNYWTSGQKVNFSFCVHCGKKNEIKTDFHPVARGLDALNILLSKKKPEEVIALFKRI